MGRIVTILVFLAAVLGRGRASHADTTVNAVIGDASWFAAHAQPPETADEVTRIRTHLTYVVAELQRRDVAAWSPRQREHRRAALASLAAYARRGVFPRRTGDAYAGRRPRFIDDRGVRCAVGELVAASGHPELAAAIAATHEYAYVRDMQVPALARWAAAQGFTIDELALIQPSYAASPTAETTRRAIEDAKDRVTLACASEGTPPARLALHVVGLRSAHTQVTTTATTPFARCFATAAGQVERGGGAYDHEITTYDFDMDVALSTPQVLLERHLARLQPEPDACTPRPGAIARRATIDVTTARHGAPPDDDHGVTVQVVTAPSNPEVTACLEHWMANQFADFRALAGLHAHRELSLGSPFAPAQVRAYLDGYTRSHATACYPAANPPARVKVSARAKVDDAAFTIVVDTTDHAFATCLAEKLQRSLRASLSVSRPVDGHYRPYFRIDREVDQTVDVPVESPKAHRQRADKAKKHLDDELHRARPD